MCFMCARVMFLFFSKTVENYFNKLIFFVGYIVVHAARFSDSGADVAAAAAALRCIVHDPMGPIW